MTIEKKTVPPTPYPKGFMWWFRNGDNWHAPLENNGAPYLPSIQNQALRDLMWFIRNPIGNFMGFVIGFEGSGYEVKGLAPVELTTWRDARPPRIGWKWSIINGWAPFISYFGGHLELYLGWRPSSGGFGAKITWRSSAYSDQVN